MEAITIYRSKINSTILVLSLFYAAAVIISSIYIGAYILPMLGAAIGLLFLLYMSRTYEVNSNGQLTFYNIFNSYKKTKVDIHSITSVSKNQSRENLFSPYQLELHLQNQNVVTISPNNEKYFLSDLKKINPKIRL